MKRTISASDSSITTLPNLSLVNPKKLCVGIIGNPFLNRSIIDHVIASLFCSLSACATTLNINNNVSLVVS
ncbi:hypothetical protein A5842_002485, partial [Enterococcus faecium]